MARVVVTGANRGIGLEIVRILSERGDEVIAVCREPSDALKQLNVTVYDGVDVTDDASVNQLASKFSGSNIDVLINNAGILTNEALGAMNWENMRRQFEVNTLGPLRVSMALLPYMSSGSKIGIVSSRMGSLADNSSGGMYGYRISKCAVNMAGQNLSLDLQPKGIAVILLHPGFVQTEMTGGRGDIKPEIAAAGLVDRMDKLGIEQTGTFWHANGEQLVW